MIVQYNMKTAAIDPVPPAIVKWIGPPARGASAARIRPRGLVA
jgi:hypothetical protein